jgi:probable rRNA maturation factor
VIEMPAMTEAIGASSAHGAEESLDAEPSRTCADILVGDERWNSIEGLEGLIPALVAATLRESGFPPEAGALSVALLSAAEVHALNKAFRGKDSGTNVLSFPAAPIPAFRPAETGPVFLGDVALSFETVTGEASAQNKTVLDHAAHLVVHGVLHLAGFSHENNAGAERMEAAERTILSKFGISDPYAEDALPGAASKI